MFAQRGHNTWTQQGWQAEYINKPISTHSASINQQTNTMRLCILYLSLSAALLSLVGGQKLAHRCNENTVNEIDGLIESILPFGNHSYRLPERVEHLDSFCQHYGFVLGEIETINKRCMRDEYRNLLALVLYNFRKSTRSLCSRRASSMRDKNAFVKLAKCANNGLDRIERCAVISRERILSMPYAKKNKKIPLLCW